METIKQAMARQKTAKENAEQFESPTISTTDDIKRVLQLLDPHARLNERLDDVDINTSIVGSDGRKNATFGVQTTTSSKSYRDILIEGFQIVQQRTEAADKIDYDSQLSTVVIDDTPMVPPQVVATDSRMAMDSIIERLLGGYRDGLCVCWDLSDGYTYRYEIFQHRLTRTQRDAA